MSRHRLHGRTLQGAVLDFAQIAANKHTTFNGHWPEPTSTSYSYRVRATDAAGSLSSY